MVTQPPTWLRQDKSLNPTGVINPETGQPYTYGPPAPVAPAVPLKSLFLSSNNNSKVVTPVEKPVTRSKYINPETGKYFQTAEEYGNYVATKIPASKPAGDIPAYAGDAMTNPDASAAELTKTATGLNNARNDIAVGATDPYKVGNQSGIAYSPAELKAIEKAYAGIYDPALNDVFAKLKIKQDEDEAKARREEMIFATNENIRQWKATTGSKSSGVGPGNTVDLFTQTQLNNGARNAGMTIEGFSKLDPDLANFFVQPPTAKDDITGETKSIDDFFKEDIAAVKAGEKTVKEVSEAILGSTLPESVKHYYLEQLPASDVEKEGWFSRVWKAITGK